MSVIISGTLMVSSLCYEINDINIDRTAYRTNKWKNFEVLTLSSNIFFQLLFSILRKKKNKRLLSLV